MAQRIVRPEAADDADLAELIRRQGIGPIEDIEELAGPPIEDADEFLAAVRSTREQ